MGVRSAEPSDDLDRLDGAAGHRPKNPFLSRVCVRLRETRPLIPDAVGYTIRTEVVGGATFARLWFRTSGCTRDRQGSCTFCNYGRGGPTHVDDMVSSVAQGLAELSAACPATLLVSPSGSMLDEIEVPAPARRAILRLVAQTAAREVLFETRAETVTDANVRELAELMVGRSAQIEIGLESSDPWIATYCVNKSLSLNDYRSAVRRINAQGLGAITNAVIGIPFLSAREAVTDAVRTVGWALDQGSGSCALFPLHVRGWTLLEWLWRRGMYQPPSLWSLVEVLHRLGPERAGRVTISWYRDYDAGVVDNDDPTRPLASPTTCPRCRDTVLRLLDDYRATRDFAVVAQLAEMSCLCHDAWCLALDAPDGGTLVERVANAYALIGRDVLGQPWWDTYGPAVIDGLTAGADRETSNVLPWAGA